MADRAKPAREDSSAFYAAAAAVVFLLAALLPLAFRTGSVETQSEEFGTGDRAAIFNAYWNDGGRGCTVRNIPGPEKTDIDTCTQRMSEIVDRCVIDTQRGAAKSAGSE